MDNLEIFSELNLPAAHSAHQPGRDIMKCPTCNRQHHAKSDVFCNRSRIAGNFDAREIFGVTTTCPICLEDCSELVALPCGHILCKSDYHRLGGFVRGISDQMDTDDECIDNLLVYIREAGQHGVNGTYRRDGINKKFTKLGKWNGEDAEFSIEIRVVKGKKMWFISCRLGNEHLVDFYKAAVNESGNYPARVRWEAASFHGTHPTPQISMSYFE